MQGEVFLHPVPRYSHLSYPSGTGGRGGRPSGSFISCFVVFIVVVVGFDMQKFVDATISPPGDKFSCYVEETSVKFSEKSLASLKKVLKSHFAANNIPIQPGFDEWVEDCACRNLPQGAESCVDESGRTPGVARKLSLADLRRFLLVVGGLIKERSDAFVSQEEADRRAAICLGCPKNIDPQGGCPACSGIHRLAEQVKGNRHSKHDGGLKSCEICGCMLKAKVWINSDILDKADAGLEWPDYCWRSNPSLQP